MGHANLVRLPGTVNEWTWLRPAISHQCATQITEITKEPIPDLVSDLLVLVKVRQVLIPHLECIMLNVIMEEEPTEAAKGSTGALALVSEGMGVFPSVRARQLEGFDIA